MYFSSQNCWVGDQPSRDHPDQPHPPRQGHLKQVTGEHVQVSLECLQRETHNLPGSRVVPELCHHPRKEILPRVEIELFVF